MSRPTNRGVLWEVLAPVVRWPLYSPRRFAAVAAAVVTVLVLLTQLGHDNPQQAAADTTSSTSTSASTQGGDMPPPSSSPGTPSSTPASSPTRSRSSGSPSPAATPQLPEAAGRAARTFLTAWARPGEPQKSWYAALKPLATPDLAKGLALTDPRNVPATTVTGELSPVEVSPNLTAPTRAVLVGDTDAGPMAVTVTLSSSTWRVQAIAPAEAADGEA